MAKPLGASADSIAMTSRVRAVTFRRLGLAAILPTALVACSAGDPVAATFSQSAEPSSQSFPIQSGYTDIVDRAAIGVIVHRDNAASTASLCSGTLISSNVALTARHCLSVVQTDTVECGQRLGPHVAPAAVEITTAITSDFSLPDDAGAPRAIEQIQIVSGGDDSCGYDLAILVLDTPYRPEEAMPLAVRTSPALAGETYSAIGYGKTCGDVTAEPCYLESGRRRRLDGLTIACTADCPRESTSPLEWRGERGACLGDSGGPALDAQGQLIGIALRGTTNDAGDCVGPVYAAVEPWVPELADWVRRGAAKTGIVTPPRTAISDAIGDANSGPPNVAAYWDTASQDLRTRDGGYGDESAARDGSTATLAEAAILDPDHNKEGPTVTRGPQEDVEPVMIAPAEALSEEHDANGSVDASGLALRSAAEGAAVTNGGCGCRVSSRHSSGALQVLALLTALGLLYTRIRWAVGSAHDEAR